MKAETITKVRNIKCHCYDGTQCETAIYAKSDKRQGYRWYVGYGGDYLPASKHDLTNMRDYTNQADILADTLDDNRYVGNLVQMYRHNLI